MVQELAATFEKAYQEFHSSFYRDRDPVRFAHLYPDPRDQEIVGLLSALLAYGNVTSILRSVASLLAPLGESPYETIRRGQYEGRFSGFVHRFTRGDDVEILCAWIQRALETDGSLQAFFTAGAAGSAPMKDRISQFVRRLWTTELSVRQKKMRDRRARNLKYLLSDPHQGSACKRLNMYLRWMVRPADGIDLGLWNDVKPADLMLPVDTHILKMLQHLRWTGRKQATWLVVEQATERLRAINPRDPIRYDFSLCHLSMEGKTSLYAPLARRSAHQKSPSRKL